MSKIARAWLGETYKIGYHSFERDLGFIPFLTKHNK